ncbi:MAG TPA: single-stranded-DNA-specific exonuclease RecJ [Anaerolineae bacterium]|nr:single-stranded-DNA-specific exonuclease RecJ [Anaerolineae bacterium]HQK13035.1 single-stranded-DNA-specific exonuclease RecJ [Anaerolineae bacterium]
MGMFACKRWYIAPPAPPAFLQRLSDIPPLVAQLLYNRGITTPVEAEAFLQGAFYFDNPFAMKDIPVAVRLLRQAIKRRTPVVIYGDYDVDGVTASAILVQTLESLGAQVKVHIPNRLDEGYGLNVEAITELAQQGARVLITVDCGIRSLNEVAVARQLGMQVIVTDHHHLGPALPQADAVINPRRPDCRYPFKDLAGVGVAYKLAQALLRVNRKVPLPTTQYVLEETELLDLVALGTVADMVSLLGENHMLVSKGLVSINAARRPGLSALMMLSGIAPGTVTTKAIGFGLAPRLNAAGRLREAMTSLDLLLAPDMKHALPLAQELNALNEERRNLTLNVQERARELVVGRGEVPPLLFAASPDFPHGVVGLVASRLLEEFYRPAVVVSIEDEWSKGSARSIPEFHITEALDTVRDLLRHHGGHSAAAGFTVATELLPELEARLIAVAREQLDGLTLSPTLYVDAEVPLASLSWEVYDALQRLEPFGYGNAEPLLVSRRVQVLDARTVGAEGRHLKLRLADERGITWDAIAFRQGAWLAHLPRQIDLAYHLEANTWNDRVNLQLNVQDIHVSGV